MIISSIFCFGRRRTHTRAYAVCIFGHFRSKRKQLFHGAWWLIFRSDMYTVCTVCAPEKTEEKRAKKHSEMVVYLSIYWQWHPGMKTKGIEIAKVFKSIHTIASLSLSLSSPSVARHTHTNHNFSYTLH